MQRSVSNSQKSLRTALPMDLAAQSALRRCLKNILSKMVSITGWSNCCCFTLVGYWLFWDFLFPGGVFYSSVVNKDLSFKAKDLMS